MSEQEQHEQRAQEGDETPARNPQHTHEGDCCPCGECCAVTYPALTDEQKAEQLKAFNKLLVSRGYEPR